MIFQEAFFDISQDPFNLPFLPGGRHLTNFGNKTELTGKVEEEQIETHQGAMAFADHGFHVVEQGFAGHAFEPLKGMHVAAAEGGQRHRVGKFQVEQAAVGFDQAKDKEPPRHLPVADLAAIGPVHLELLSGREFDPYESRNRTAGTDLMQIAVENAMAVLETQSTQPFEEALATEFGVLNQSLLTQGTEGIQFAFAFPFCAFNDRTQNVLADGLAVHSQVLGNFTQAPLFNVGKLVDGMNFFRG